MEHGQSGGRHGEPVDAGDAPLALEHSWIGVSRLLVWFALYGIVGASDFPDTILPQAGHALIYAAAGALIGIAVFLPANPPGLRLRAAVYAVPVLGLTLLMAFTPGNFYTSLTLAFLPAWALVTALYGVRGGLSQGVGSVFTYLAVGGFGVGLGVVILFTILTIAFAEPPGVTVLGWFLPLLQLLSLRRPRYRGRRLRSGVEIALSVLLVACGTVGVFPGASHEVATLIAGAGFAIAVFPTAALAALGRADQSDTAGYQTRKEGSFAASRTEPVSGPGRAQSDTDG